MAESLPVLVVRYDGKDADHHELDMKDLAESLQGLSRIIGVCANFALTQKHVQHKDALAVRVFVRPPTAGCFSVEAAIHWLDQHAFAGAVASGLTVSLIAYTLKKAAGDREEMRQLRGALDNAIRELGARDTPVIERLLSTIDKMADSLRPAAKLAVAPIGRSASILSVKEISGVHPMVTIDQADRDAITAEAPSEVSTERDFTILISELDMQSGSCKFSFDAEPSARLAGIVTDPAVFIARNAYALSMAECRAIVVRAKAVTRDGEIEKLYVSDYVG